MLLPKNGRIVVIDDKYEEALPLLRSIWQNGFAAIYFNGERKYLPQTPLDDVRVIFLDMELETGGYTGSDNKTKAATTARILKSIINTQKNSVYLIIMWAMHEELEDDFWTYIRKDSNCDFIQLKLDKTKCMTNEEILPAEITSVLKSNNAFSFFINWENMIHKSSNDIILDFSSFFSVDADWDRKILEILKKLAEEYAGKNLNASDHEQIVRYAMLALNGTFTDSLENNIVRLGNTGISFDGVTGVPDVGAISKINSKLLLDQNNTTAKPGCIYSNSENDELDDYFDNSSAVDQTKIQKIFCEVSPTCDYSNQKWKCHRILYGIKVAIEQIRYVKKKADYLHKTSVFDIRGQSVKFVFDLRKLRSKDLGELDSLPVLCTLRHDLIVDIQHKIASHSSRPGILSL